MTIIESMLRENEGERTRTVHDPNRVNGSPVFRAGGRSLSRTRTPVLGQNAR
jgi:hypothetical protein